MERGSYWVVKSQVQAGTLPLSSNEQGTRVSLFPHQAQSLQRYDNVNNSHILWGPQAAKAAVLARALEKVQLEAVQGTF